jgi:hypothetical protein
MIRGSRLTSVLLGALVAGCSAGEIRLLETSPAPVTPDAAGDAAGGSAGTGGATADAGACVDCDQDEVCHPASRQCADRCASDGDCSSGDRPHCDLPVGACVQCRSDVDCEGDRPRCLAASCVECVSDFDCTDPSDPLCASDHQCRH